MKFLTLPFTKKKKEKKEKREREGQKHNPTSKTFLKLLIKIWKTKIGAKF